jgi:hypothetical protein
MKRRGTHCGILYQDCNKRFYLREFNVSEEKTVICTSSCPLEVLLNSVWIAGRVEGDGEDYWFFASTGASFCWSSQGYLILKQMLNMCVCPSISLESASSFP